VTSANRVNALDMAGRDSTARDGDGRVGRRTSGASAGIDPPTEFLGSGLFLLVAGKGADVATTLAGLALVPALGEANPVASLAMARFGPVAGLLLLGGAVVLGTVAVVEFGTAELYRRTGSAAASIGLRVAGYGFVSATSFAAAVHNATLVAEHTSAGSLVGLA